MRRLFGWKAAALAVALVLVCGVGFLAAKSKVEKPKSVMHAVIVKWKDGTTPAQIKAAMDGVEKMAAAYSGIRRSTSGRRGYGSNRLGCHGLIRPAALDALR